MDEFDVVDFVYDAVNAANLGIPIYKDRSESGVTGDHVVINHLNLNEFDFYNKIHINVNILVPLKPNGMYSRQSLKALKRKVRSSLDTINSDDGECREIEVLFSEPIPDVKDGFMCLNIRVEVLIDN